MTPPANLIVLCLDSFRQDHVGAYHGGRGPFAGVAACRTPNLDAFAGGALAFDSAYACSLPTIPIRTELMTGQCILGARGWTPLRGEATIAQLLGAEGFTCGLISDVWHYQRPGMNFHQGFHAYRWIRGQEYDPYTSTATRRRLDDYVTPGYNAYWRDLVNRFLANTDGFGRPEDWFTAQVVDQAVAWLGANRGAKRLFCWIDVFDPHEPWDPPEGFDAYTDPAYRGPRLIMPMGGRALDWASEEQVRHIRGLYAGEAAHVDHCLGPLFAALARLGYLEDSAVLVLADHGHPLADHGKFLKGGDRLHNEMLRVPFLLRLPGGRTGRTGALVQYPDVLPTLLELLQVPAGPPVHGTSFAAVARGGTDRHRAVAVGGYHEAAERFVRDDRWSYVVRPEGQPDELYDLAADPRETSNLVDRHPDEARRLAAALPSALRRHAARAVKGIQGRYEVVSGTTG